MKGLVRENRLLHQHTGKECGQVKGDGRVAEDVEGGEHGQGGEGQVVVITLRICLAL